MIPISCGVCVKSRIMIGKLLVELLQFARTYAHTQRPILCLNKKFIFPIRSVSPSQFYDLLRPMRGVVSWRLCGDQCQPREEDGESWKGLHLPSVHWEGQTREGSESCQQVGMLPDAWCVSTWHCSIFNRLKKCFHIFVDWLVKLRGRKWRKQSWRVKRNRRYIAHVYTQTHTQTYNTATYLPTGTPPP